MKFNQYCALFLAFIALSFSGCWGSVEPEDLNLDDFNQPPRLNWSEMDYAGFDSAIQAVAWGNNKYVAAGQFGKMAYSSDGINWTAVPNSTFGSEWVFDIAWGGDKFVAVGSNSKVAYSHDGINWVPVPDVFDYEIPIICIIYGEDRFIATAGNESVCSFNGMTWFKFLADFSYNKICYGKRKVVATTSNGEIASYDYDEEEWNYCISPHPGVHMHSIAFGNNRFVIAGDEGKMIYSDDGRNWNNVNSTIFDNQTIFGIVWGADKFIATGIDRIAYSSDGIEWKRADDKNIYCTFNGVTWGNNKFICFNWNSEMAYSSDGIKWTYLKCSPFGNTVYDIACGNERYVAVGEYGIIAGKDYSYDEDVLFFNAQFADLYMKSIAWGNGKFVAVGDEGKIIYTNDGWNWFDTADKPFNSESLNGIAFGNGKFVCGGLSAFLAYSNDGVNWGPPNKIDISHLDICNQVNSINWVNDRFIAIGLDNKMAWSYDGIDWGNLPNSLFDEGFMNSFAWGDGIYVAGGNRIAYSTDFLDWKMVNAGAFPGIIRSICYGNGFFVAGGYDGKIAYSRDGIKWTSFNDSAFGTNVVRKIVWCKNRFIAGGDQGIIAYFIPSEDNKLLK